MKSTPMFFLAIVVAGLLYACSEKSKNEKSRVNVPTANSVASQAADSVQVRMPSSSAAVETGKDTTRKFIRTADLKFKVKNVVNTTYAIEDIVNLNEGFVTYTNLYSTVNSKSTIAVSVDSSLETTYYTVVNSMTLRVPNTKLDTALKSIATLIDYMDYRVIRADDVALQILTNKLTQQRIAKNEQRLTNAIDNRGKKLNETSSAEELLLNKQAQMDQAKISNLSLQDQISYSTVTLNLYQRESVMRELIPNNQNITAYTPALGKRLMDALKDGWEAVEAILVVVAECWWLVVLGLLGYLAYRRYRTWEKL